LTPRYGMCVLSSKKPELVTHDGDSLRTSHIQTSNSKSNISVLCSASLVSKMDLECQHGCVVPSCNKTSRGTQECVEKKTEIPLPVRHILWKQATATPMDSKTLLKTRMVLCLCVQLSQFKFKSRKRIPDVGGERRRSFQTRSPKAPRHICMCHEMEF